MCGIVGWANYKKNLKDKIPTLEKMTQSLEKRGPDSFGYHCINNVLMGHRRLSIIDLEGGHQPMTRDGYTIIYNGELYNTENLRNKLIEEGVFFKTNSDTEVLLQAFIKWKEKCLEYLDGIFAFAILNEDSIFMARDRIGVKPLFYAKQKNDFLFASEIKAILKSKIIKPIIDKKGLQELLALGPSKAPGSGVFKGIYELKPGHYLIFKKGKLKIKKYWDVQEKTQNESFDETVKNVKKLVEEAIKKQMVSDVGIATFLSGGLDSSVITSVAQKNSPEPINTHSIDYEGNSKHFKQNDYQVSEDRTYIELFTKQIKNKHNYHTISQKTLARLLKEAMIARDLPGMADIDSSLLWFSKQISKEHKVVLSGEGADEIFGGYPWFYKKELLDIKGFPWIRNLEKREALLNPSLRKKLKLKKFAYKKYKETIKEMPKIKNKTEKKHKILMYLNLKWFMTTLLDRKDRMTMSSSLEARVPFTDHKLIEYLWNVPFDYKFYNETEKGLLREAFKNELPKEIITRKKNPYPKTHHPKYTKIVAHLLKSRLKKPNSILPKIFDIEKLEELIQTKGASYTSPWFGQLMTGPQLIAYLYQFDLWAEEYEIILKI